METMKSIWTIIKNPLILIFLLLLLLILLIVLNYFCILNLDGALDYLISIFGLIIGLLLIVWQIGEQHRNSLKAQNESTKQKMKLDVFSDLDSTLNKSQHSLINTGTIILTLPQKFDLRIFQENMQSSLGLNFQAPPVQERVELLTNVHFGAITELSSVVIVLEKY